MSMGTRNSREVVEFLTLFTKMQGWIDDEPADLLNLAANDQSVMDLCRRLSSAAYYLKTNERQARELFASPVDPTFLSKWRDYESRYESTLALVWLLDFMPELAEGQPSCIPRADLQWSNADSEANVQARGIEEAMEFARENIEQSHRWDDYPEFREKIQDGISAWEHLKESAGFDLHGAFRRRALIPFVLVPRQVSDRHGSAETISLLTNLRQAHDAFVFGVPYAALALLRSIVEAVLRDHYKVDGIDLADRIQNADRRLPHGASKAALHRLRKLANAILHLDLANDKLPPVKDRKTLEKEIVSLLFVVRNLIEAVPPLRGPQ